MGAKEINWCPQHGYPLPCFKCGMPLSQMKQKDIYELGRGAGIKEVVEWLENNLEPTIPMSLEYEKLQAQKKIWGIDEEVSEKE